jgi:hypothetical protein
MNSRWKTIGMVVAAGLAVALLIVVTVVRATNPTPAPQSQGSESTRVQKKTATNKEGYGSESDDWTTIPDGVTRRVDRVMTALITDWSKKDGDVTEPSMEKLQAAGLSSECAASYESVWNNVFARAHTGSPSPGANPVESIAINDVEGSKPTRTYSLTVTARVRAAWVAADGSAQTFSTERDSWVLVVDEASDSVTSITQPDPIALGFRIPDDLIPPAPRSTQEDSE